MESNPIDRRRKPRFVKISLMQADSYLIGQTLDLSMVGTRILLHCALPVDAAVQMDLAAGDIVLEIGARVIRVNRVGEDRYEIGLQFTAVDPETSRLLRAYIERVESR